MAATTDDATTSTETTKKEAESLAHRGDYRWGHCALQCYRHCYHEVVTISSGNTDDRGTGN